MSKVLRRRSVFVAAPYALPWVSFVEKIAQPSISMNQSMLIRLEKEDGGNIAQLIKDAVVAADCMIALVSGFRPFVYLEIGIALGARKPLVVCGANEAEVRPYAHVGETVILSGICQDDVPNLAEVLRRLLSRGEI